MNHLGMDTKYEPQYSVHSEYRSIFHEIIMKNIYLRFFMVVFVCFFGITEGIHAQQGNVIVPNMEGIPVEVAAQVLRTTGLQPRIQGTLKASAIVIRQNPRPGFALAAGSEVILVTSAVSTATVPEGRGSRPLPQSWAQSSGSRGMRSVTTVGSSGGTEVSVPPPTSSSQRYPTTTYQAPQEDEFTIFNQPQQTPSSKYLLADTRPKKYPPWYPKEFLTQHSSQNMAAQPQAQDTGNQVQTLSQSSEGSSISVGPMSQWYAGWYYPEEWASQRNDSTSNVQVQSNVQAQSSIQTQPTASSGQDVSPQTQTSGTDIVLVPNLMRLRQQDALFAIHKAGLSVGRITRAQNSQWGVGLIMRQSPRARTIVPAGTRVDLWVAN